MELVEAIRSRRSIRGYKPDPVPKEVLSELLEIATRSPSAVNTQPWEFTVLGGEVLEELRRANEEQVLAGADAAPDIPIDPATGVYRERQVAVGVKLFQLLGIAREDREKRIAWNRRQHRFFEAPNAILITVDKSALGTWSVFDAGLATQTIALAAQQFGLGTCIQRAGVHYPEVVRRVVGIPDSKLIVVSIAIGYPDPDYPANKLRTDREPLENIVTWLGVD